MFFCCSGTGDGRRCGIYRRALAGIGGEEWAGEGPGNLPWWRLGRPTEEERLKRSEGAYIDELGRSTAMWRPRIEARDWVNLACSHLGVNPEELKGHGRDPEIVKCRELIGLVGIERYGVKVNELAEVLEKSRDGVSKWMRRGAVRRVSDPDLPRPHKRWTTLRGKSPNCDKSAKRCLAPFHGLVPARESLPHDPPTGPCATVSDDEDNSAGRH